ncbi:MAG: hypothetical protein WBL80_08715 [Erysipelotrichaceae bacterium]
MENTKMTKKTILTILLMTAVIMSLAGCSNTDKKQIAQLETKISQLEKEKQDLLIKSNEILAFFTGSKFKNNIYDCANPYGGIQHVKFLSSSIVHVTGVDEYKAPMYNNYYIYTLKDQFTLTLIGDIDMPDSLNLYTYTNLLTMADLLKTITFSQDFKTITISPVNEYSTCTLRK